MDPAEVTLDAVEVEDFGDKVIFERFSVVIEIVQTLLVSLDIRVTILSIHVSALWIFFRIRLMLRAFEAFQVHKSIENVVVLIEDGRWFCLRRIRIVWKPTSYLDQPIHFGHELVGALLNLILVELNIR